MSQYRKDQYKLNTREVSVLLGYSQHWVRVLAQEGEIPAIKNGRKEWRFCLEEIQEKYIIEMGAQSDEQIEEKEDLCDILR